jgi:hypothetical protein
MKKTNVTPLNAFPQHYAKRGIHPQILTLSAPGIRYDSGKLSLPVSMMFPFPRRHEWRTHQAEKKAAGVTEGTSGACASDLNT